MAVSSSTIYLIKRKSSTGLEISGALTSRLLDLLKYYCKIKKFKFYYISEKDILKKKFSNNSYVFFSRFILNKKTIHFLKKKKERNKIKLIVDIDDLIWKSSGSPEYKKNKSKWIRSFGLFKTVDLVLFSNSILQKTFYQSFDKTFKSVVILSYINAAKYNNHILNNGKNKNLILYSKTGFFASRKNKMFEKIITTICKEFKLKLLCISQHPLNIEKKYLIYHKPMEFKKYIKKILNKNILLGIVPIGTSEEQNAYEWNRSKSYFKYLFYASAGIPTVFSDIEPYNKIIKHSHNGLLSKNTFASWYQNLKLLVTNIELRKRIKNNCLIDTSFNHNVHEGSLHLERALKVLTDK